jgi:PucR C-terminal helix-turn-helix domain/GGDEF-like domain
MTRPGGSEASPVAVVGERLLGRVDELATELSDLIRGTEAYYSAQGAVPPEDLRASVRDNLVHILSRFAGHPTPGLEPARATGRRRAEQGVPLPVILHAYRIAGKFIWAAILAEAAVTGSPQSALLDAASDLWFIIDELSGVVTTSYRDTVDERARQSQQTRSAMMEVLLRGDIAEGSRLWEYTNALRLPRQGTYVVAAARTPTPGTESIPNAEGALRHRGVQSAWRVEVDAQIGVLALTPRAGLERVCGLLAELATGPVGVSEPYSNLDTTPAALREARLALHVASSQAGLVRYGAAPIAILLASAPDAAAAVARMILGPVLALPDADCESILATLDTWFAEDGATSVAAERMHLHRNTVRYRLRRLEELTGRSLAQPTGLAELHLALEATRILGLRPGASGGEPLTEAAIRPDTRRDGSVE